VEVNWPEIGIIARRQLASFIQTREKNWKFVSIVLNIFSLKKFAIPGL